MLRCLCGGLRKSPACRFYFYQFFMFTGGNFKDIYFVASFDTLGNILQPPAIAEQLLDFVPVSSQPVGIYKQCAANFGRDFNDHTRTTSASLRARTVSYCICARACQFHGTGLKKPGGERNAEPAVHGVPVSMESSRTCSST